MRSLPFTVGTELVPAVYGNRSRHMKLTLSVIRLFPKVQCTAPHLFKAGSVLIYKFQRAFAAVYGICKVFCIPEFHHGFLEDISGIYVCFYTVYISNLKIRPGCGCSDGFARTVCFVQGCYPKTVRKFKTKYAVFIHDFFGNTIVQDYRFIMATVRVVMTESCIKHR